MRIKRQLSNRRHEQDIFHKNVTIQKENQQLLSKLVEIVGRKKSITLPDVGYETSTFKKSHSRAQTSKSQCAVNMVTVPHPFIKDYSLNGTWRKREFERIEKEN